MRMSSDPNWQMISHLSFNWLIPNKRYLSWFSHEIGNCYYEPGSPVSGGHGLTIVIRTLTINHTEVCTQSRGSFIGQLGNLCVILEIKFSKIWCCTIHWLWECYHSGLESLPLASIVNAYTVKPEYLWPLINLIMDPNDKMYLSGIRSASVCPWHSLMLHLTDNTGWSGPHTGVCSVLSAPHKDKRGGLTEHPLLCLTQWLIGWSEYTSPKLQLVVLIVVLGHQCIWLLWSTWILVNSNHKICADELHRLRNTVVSVDPDCSSWPRLVCPRVSTFSALCCLLAVAGAGGCTCATQGPKRVTRKSFNRLGKKTMETDIYR